MGHLLYLSHIHEEVRDTEIAIMNVTIVIVSYGSYMVGLDPEKSTAACIFYFSVTDIRYFGVVILVNKKKETTPYQS